MIRSGLDLVIRPDRKNIPVKAIAVDENSTIVIARLGWKNSGALSIANTQLNGSAAPTKPRPKRWFIEPACVKISSQLLDSGITPAPDTAKLVGTHNTFKATSPKANQIAPEDKKPELGFWVISSLSPLA